jgi:predicted alpha-1,6-mannanase (GH76 family)
MRKRTFMRRVRHGMGLLALTVCNCTGRVATAGSTGTIPPPSTYSQQAAAGIQTLQHWYSQSSGVYASPAGWWNSANAITVVANYTAASGSSQYQSVLSNTFASAPLLQGHPNFINNYYDDSGWWALAWIAAYDATGNSSYLSMAETIFTFMTGGWDSVCGGGLYWTTAKKYKNAIPNELFLDVAAKLANRTTGSGSASYLAWAQKEWTWFSNSGMINSSNLINDGLSSSCVNNNGKEWTYNQGVILGGLVELSKAAQDPTLLPKAGAIANAAITKLVDADGILVEASVKGGDAPQFKGIFTRNLMALYQAVPHAQYKTFIDVNANSIWTNDQGPDYEFGALWQGPFDSGDATRQTCALDTLIAAMEVQ